MTKLNSTAYALLGLLARRPWTAYDLAKYMRSGLANAFNARAASQLYAEAKRLNKQGFADISVQYNGRRKSQLYSITESGRAALKTWLESGPSATFQDEWETMLRLIFQDQGSVAGMEDVLSQMEQEIRQYLLEIAEKVGNVLVNDRFAPHFLLNAEVLDLLVSIQELRLTWLKQLRQRLKDPTPLTGPETINPARNRYLQTHHRVVALLTDTGD